MTTGGFDRSIVDSIGHRPWPMPDSPWVMTQSWNSLLFAHWRVGPSQMRRLVPAAFDLDLFDGDAWLGVVPFYMTNVGFRGAPPLPWLSAFAELNVRTYVRVNERPGVYFFSLDAGRRLAVAAARTFLNLPYFSAAMRFERRGASVQYHSRRRRGAGEFRARYEPAGSPLVPSAGSLEYFLTERYCLYHQDRQGRPYRLEIHHRPWSLQVARAEIALNTMAAASAIALDGSPAFLHFAERQDAVAWAPTRLSGSGRPGG